jgi:hypothetical protein
MTMLIAVERLRLRQRKIVLLLQVVTTTMIMTVDQPQLQQRLLVQLQLLVLPQVDLRLQQRLQARLEGPNPLTNLVFFCYQKISSVSSKS